MTEQTKVQENRVRRKAQRQGLLLSKSRRRDTNAVDFGGYMLIDAATNAVVIGSGAFAFSATLGEIEKYLGTPRKKRKR